MGKIANAKAKQGEQGAVQYTPLHCGVIGRSVRYFPIPGAHKSLSPKKHHGRCGNLDLGSADIGYYYPYVPTSLQANSTFSRHDVKVRYNEKWPG
jgi:hypothetical protein